MNLKSLLDFVLQQGKYVVIAVIVFTTVKHFAKSKVAGIMGALLIGSLAYFFLSDPDKVLQAIGNVINKVFGG